MLTVNNLYKSFYGILAINNISFSVNSNEIIGIIGPNGAGKTTLFNLISGFYKPDKGTIVFNNKIISGKKPFEICRMGIGRVFQEVKPFMDMTLLENIMIGAFVHTHKIKDAKAKAGEILSFLGMENKAETLAANLTIVDRKRLELGRALATSPQLLLLDEVAAGLNPKEMVDFLETIVKVRMMNITILIIEHNLQAIMKISDKVIVLDYGVLIAQGTPEEVANNPKVIEAYLGGELDAGS